MDITVMFMIKDGRQEEVEVKAYGKDSATIFIKADSIATASSLLLQAEPQAAEAMQNWEDVQEEVKAPAEPQKHFRIGQQAVEDIQAELDEFTSTTKGAKYIKALETAQDFCYRKANGGMKYSELKYFFNLAAIGNEWDAIGGAYHIAYRRGY